MKKIILLFVFTIASTIPSMSQGWRIAPTIGVNLSNIAYSATFRNNLNTSGLSTKTGPLIQGQLGALIDYAFSDRFSIRSGLVYTSRGGGLYITSSQYGISESVRGSYKFSYIDMPLLLNFAVDHNNWRIIVGGVASYLLSARGSVESAGSFSNYGYYNGTSTYYLGANQVQSLDFSANIGFVKELEVANRPLEIGLYSQNSITKWNVSAQTQSDLYARHNLVGLRIAYLLGLHH